MLGWLVLWDTRWGDGDGEACLIKSCTRVRLHFGEKGGCTLDPEIPVL
jgi:hypothetical protein